MIENNNKNVSGATKNNKYLQFFLGINILPLQIAEFINWYNISLFCWRCYILTPCKEIPIWEIKKNNNSDLDFKFMTLMIWLEEAEKFIYCIHEYLTVHFFFASHFSLGNLGDLLHNLTVQLKFNGIALKCQLLFRRTQFM